MSMKFLKTVAGAAVSSLWEKVSGNVVVKDTSANVGIGTDDPDDSRLYITQDSASNPVLTLLDTDAIAYDFVFPDTNTLKITCAGGADRTFELNNSAGGVFNLKTDGNLVIGTAGKGIDFSAQTPAAGMTAELLDHYECGTFTPVIADASTGGNTGSGTVVGLYTRIGRVVNFSMSLSLINTSGMTAGNVIYFRGLPFTASSSVNGFPQSALIHTVTFSDDYVVGRVNGNDTLIILQEMDSGAVWGSLTVAAISSGASYIYVQGSYPI